MYFDPKEFGKRLKEIRVVHGLTQEKLAEELNISWDHLSKIERGARSCSIDLLIAISGHFGVSTDYLLTGKDVGVRPHEEIVNMCSYFLNGVRPRSSGLG